MILSVHYFYVKTKMLADFQSCISVPLTYFTALVSFSTPWKQQNQMYSDALRGYGKSPVAWNGLKCRFLCKKICQCFSRQYWFRSSRPEVFCKNYAKFTGKHLCWSLFFNKVAGLRQLQACNFIQKETPRQVFSCEIYVIFKNIYLKSICQRLLLNTPILRYKSYALWWQ